MKKTILILLLITFFQNNLNAQNSITVLISGGCSDITGNYEYSGLINSKNSYTQTFINDGVITIGFDGIKWVLFANGQITNPRFINNDVPAGLLPPSTGWQYTQCPEAMIIIQNLSTNDFNNFDGKILIYPNPTNNFITIKNEENSLKDFKYKILDLTGRDIINGKSKFNEQINIERLTSGNYIIQIETENGHKLTKNLIKN